MGGVYLKETARFDKFTSSSASSFPNALEFRDLKALSNVRYSKLIDSYSNVLLQTSQTVDNV